MLKLLVFFFFLSFFFQRLIFDRHQILTRVRRRPECIKLGKKFAAPPPKKKWRPRPQNSKIRAQFLTTSTLIVNISGTKQDIVERINGFANCNLSCSSAVNLVQERRKIGPTQHALELRASGLVVRASLS